MADIAAGGDVEKDSHELQVVTAGAGAAADSAETEETIEGRAATQTSTEQKELNATVGAGGVGVPEDPKQSAAVKGRARVAEQIEELNRRLREQVDRLVEQENGVYKATWEDYRVLLPKTCMVQEEKDISANPLWEHKVVVEKGDGHCLPRALGRHYFGDPELWSQIRFLIAVCVRDDPNVENLIAPDVTLPAHLYREGLSSYLEGVLGSMYLGEPDSPEFWNG